MNWHAACTHACTCTSHQSNSSFARSLPPRAVAIGRTIKLPPLGRPATFIIHDQMYGDRRAGARSWGQCDRHAPVRVNLFRGQGFSPERLGRGALLRSFSANRRGCSPSVANINDAADHLLHNRSDRFPSHSTAPRLYGHNRRAGDIGLCPTPPRRSQKCLN
jgi:hypothetical protein